MADICPPLTRGDGAPRLAAHTPGTPHDRESGKPRGDWAVAPPNVATGLQRKIAFSTLDDPDRLAAHEAIRPEPPPRPDFQPQCLRPKTDSESLDATGSRLP